MSEWMMKRIPGKLSTMFHYVMLMSRKYIKTNNKNNKIRKLYFFSSPLIHFLMMWYFMFDCRFCQEQQTFLINIMSIFTTLSLSLSLSLFFFSFSLFFIYFSTYLPTHKCQDLFLLLLISHYKKRIQQIITTRTTSISTNKKS